MCSADAYVVSPFSILLNLEFEFFLQALTTFSGNTCRAFECEINHALLIFFFSRVKFSKAICIIWLKLLHDTSQTYILNFFESCLEWTIEKQEPSWLEE